MYLTIVITIYTVLNSLTVKVVFSSHGVPSSLVAGNRCCTFRGLNRCCGVNGALVIVCTVTGALKRMTTLMFSVSTPLGILLNSTSDGCVPTDLYHAGTSNAPIGNCFLALILITVLVVLPALNVNSVGGLCG